MPGLPGGTDVRLEARRVSQTADVRRLQKKMLEGPSGCGTTADLPWPGREVGSFALSFLWGVLRTLGVDGSPEEMESQLHPDTPQAVTPA